MPHHQPIPRPRIWPYGNAHTGVHGAYTYKGSLHCTVQLKAKLETALKYPSHIELLKTWCTHSTKSHAACKINQVDPQALTWEETQSSHMKEGVQSIFALLRGGRVLHVHKERLAKVYTQLLATVTSGKWQFFFALELLEFFKICMHYFGKFLKHNLLKRKPLIE